MPTPTPALAEAAKAPGTPRKKAAAADAPANAGSQRSGLALLFSKPMILFFLPVLFIVILTPAMIQVMGWK